jgi:hypothetical protein
MYRLIANSGSSITGQLLEYINTATSTFIDATNEASIAKSNGKVVKLVDDDVVTQAELCYRPLAYSKSTQK